MYIKNRKKQIRILGAGISGMVAGIILARNGYNVEIFEKQSQIGSYFEKDIHSLRNYSFNGDIIKEYKKIGIEIKNIYPIFKEIRFSPSLKHIEIYSENDPIFYNFIRGYKDKRSFDHELFETASEQGVKINFNCVKNQNINNVDIIATGTPCSKKKGIAYGVHYKGKSNFNFDSIHYLLDCDCASAGYIYITPFLNEFSLVIANTKIESKDWYRKKFKKLIENNIVIKNILKNVEFENEIFGYAFFSVPKTAIKNRKLYIGEAAGFLDAATGFGIHYAIISGYLAAQSIINNENYNKLWKNHFGKELKDRYLKRLYLQKMQNRDYENIIESLINKKGNRMSIEEYKACNI